MPARPWGVGGENASIEFKRPGLSAKGEETPRRSGHSRGRGGGAGFRRIRLGGGGHDAAARAGGRIAMQQGEDLPLSPDATAKEKNSHPASRTGRIALGAHLRCSRESGEASSFVLG